MRMFILAISTAVVASTICVSSALAQESTAQAQSDSHARGVEVTPFVALGSQGASSIGTFVTFPLTPNVSIETELGYRRGEGDINALSSSANLLYALPRAGRVIPYLAAGAGLMQYGAPLFLPDGSIGTQSRITVAVNAGGGLKVPVDETWGMRTDVRWFKGFGRQASEHWRVAHGVSFGAGKP
jgi:hypothetical protein